MNVALSSTDILAAIPQQDPFRFIDDIVEVDDEHIVASYRFRADHDFYRGHFPGKPITPGVILIETMAQAAVVAHGLYLLAKEKGMDEVSRTLSVFTDANVEFAGMVPPGARVVTTGKKLFFRRMKFRSDVRMHLEDGTLVCSGQLSGVGVRR
jgi:3-hydroxyacyl-[acyl-carrier-protein] dehydratase